MPVDFRTRKAALKARIQARVFLHNAEKAHDMQGEMIFATFLLVSALLMCYWTLIPFCVMLAGAVYNNRGVIRRDATRKTEVFMFNGLADHLTSMLETGTTDHVGNEEETQIRLAVLEARYNALEEMFPLN